MTSGRHLARLLVAFAATTTSDTAPSTVTAVANGVDRFVPVQMGAAGAWRSDA